MSLLEVNNLKVGFKTDQGFLTAVDDISFQVKKGKTLGIVGESGCGKSVSALSIMRLIQSPPGKIYGGEILFKKRPILTISEKEMRGIRGNHISMIFQEPMTSLNPVFSVGNQIAEAISLHQKKLSRKEVLEKTVEMLELVGIPEAKKRLTEYPHQLSGGMRQRVMIAMALSSGPELLIADEPTTALDVTIQAQILELINGLQQKLNMAMILITHDLGVVAETCDDVAVMYAGKIIEYGTVQDIFYRSEHHYTKGLIDSVPHFETDKKLKRLKAIHGMVPSLLDIEPGCRFRKRCSFAQTQCEERHPDISRSSDNHTYSCYFPRSTQGE